MKKSRLMVCFATNARIKLDNDAYLNGHEF